MTPPRLTELRSGVRVVTEHMPHVRSVSVGVFVDVGSRDEPPRVAGATHFLEHLLFKGTTTRTAEQISAEIETVGGELNAYTTKEYTAFYARVLDDDLALAIDVLTDIVRRPTFLPSELESERNVVLDEIRLRDDAPDDLVQDLWYETLWPDHPLGRPVLGTKESIIGMARSRIADWFATRYGPGDLVVAAAGRVDHDDIVRRLEGVFEGANGSASQSNLAQPEVRSVTEVVERDGEQAHLVVGTRGLARTDPDRWALSVLTHVLGGGMSSRLFVEVRERRGLAYSVYAWRSPFRETGAVGVSCSTSPEHVVPVLSLIRSEYAKAAASGVSEGELARAKSHVRGSMALSMEDSGSRMSRIGRNALLDGELLTLDEVVGRVEQVSLNDVARVADRVLSDAPMVLAAIGPLASRDVDGFAGAATA